MRLRLMLKPGIKQSIPRPLRRATFIILATVLLSGCFQAQLNGPVAGATVYVTALDDPNRVYASATTWDPAYAQLLNGGDTWATSNAATKLWWLGVFQLNVAFLDNDTWYLVSATEGEETDADGNLLMDDAFTPVNGRWRALMTGAQLKGIGPKVSPVTEAAYLWIAGSASTLGSADLRANLDRAAGYLVGDVDSNGLVDYADLLGYSPQFNPFDLVADKARVKALADHVIAGGIDDDRALRRAPSAGPR